MHPKGRGFESRWLHFFGKAKVALTPALGPARILVSTMESLEIIVAPVILVGALLLGGIFTSVVVHWLRTTEPLQ